MITVTAPVWTWTLNQGRWHFLTVPADQAVEIRLQALGERRGFGSVRVIARVGAVEWRTSLFPERKSGGYILPLKAEVRRRAGIDAGDEVEVELDLV